MKAYAIKGPNRALHMNTIAVSQMLAWNHFAASTEFCSEPEAKGYRCVEVWITERGPGDLGASLCKSIEQRQPDDIPNGYLESVEAAIKAGPKLPPDVPIAELEGRCEAPVGAINGWRNSPANRTIDWFCDPTNIPNGALIYTSPPAPEGLSLTDDTLDAGACAFLGEKDKWPEGHENRSVGHLLRVAIIATLAAAPAGKVYPSWVQFVRTVAGPAFNREDLREEAKLMLAAKEK